MSDTFSEFHDNVCQGSHFIYSGHFEQSITFYKEIGFTQIHKENKFICVLRMKNIYIEIWDNDNRFPTTETLALKRDCLNSSLIVYIQNLEALSIILRHVKNQGISTDEDGMRDLGHPLGHNFYITDPDKNRVTFATGPVWSHPAYYEHQCELRKTQLLEKQIEDEKSKPKNKILYPDFGNDDALDDLDLSFDDDDSET